MTKSQEKQYKKDNKERKKMLLDYRKLLPKAQRGRLHTFIQGKV